MKILKELLKYYHLMNRNSFTTVAYDNGKETGLEPYCYRVHGRYVVRYKTLIEIDEFAGIVIYRHPDTEANGVYGGWYNKDDGIFYIEKNKTFTNKKEALKFGKRNNQKFIWDGKEQKEIEV